ncbi:MAG: metallophosphoesterase family protein [Methanotrichaceae archaeon]
MTEKSCRNLLALIFLCAVCIVPAIAQTSSHYWSPWVTMTTTNSATINWRTETNESGVIYYDTTSYFNQHQSFRNGKSVHTVAQYQHVQLTRLQLNTTYTYWVRPSGDKFAFGNRTFRTFPISGPFTFIVVGDTREGINYSETQRFKYVADAIANESNVLFVLHGGDFARFDNTSRWATFFQCADRMLAKFTFFPVIGNHEYHNRSNENLDEEHYHICPEHCIQCNNCSPETGAVNFKSAFDMPLNYSFDCAGVRFIILNSPDPISNCCDDPQTSLNLSEAQAPWLEQLLKDNNEGVFTIHHHPIWDAGRTKNNSDLTPWDKLYHKYNISANFAGHTHNYQRYNISGIPYLVVGNGGAPNDDVNNSTKYPNGLQSVLPMQLGYLKVTVDPENNTATACEVTVAKLSCWECPVLPQLYNPPVINDTFTFFLKPAPYVPPTPPIPPRPAPCNNVSKTINKEQINIGNKHAATYGSGSATNNINILTSQ